MGADEGRTVTFEDQISDLLIVYFEEGDSDCVLSVKVVLFNFEKLTHCLEHYTWFFGVT